MSSEPPKLDIASEINGNRCFDDDTLNCPCTSTCCMFTTKCIEPTNKQLEPVKQVIKDVKNIETQTDETILNALR